MNDPLTTAISTFLACWAFVVFEMYVAIMLYKILRMKMMKGKYEVLTRISSELDWKNIKPCLVDDAKDGVRFKDEKTMTQYIISLIECEE